MSLREHLRQPAILGMLLFLAAVAGTHLWLVSAGPTPRLWGDEPMYAAHAKEDAASGDTGILPGQLPFRTRPELAARLHASFADTPGLYRSVAYLNIALFVLILAATFGQARLLGLSPGASLFAAGTLGLFPWFAFHVHSLWPEILHGALCSILFLCMLLALRRNAVRWLIPAGVAAAYALFAKGALLPFLPFFAGILAAGFHQRARSDGQRSPWRPALLAAVTFLGSTGLVLAPQLIANAQAGHGPRLAANRWWNLELGLTANPREGRKVGLVNQNYFDASTDPTERERLARERTLEFVRETGITRVLAAQLSKLRRLVFERTSTFEKSLGEMQRWGADPPARWSLWRLPGRVLWFLLLAGGLIGLALSGRRDAGWLLLSVFTLLYFGAAALVPLKVRFLMPVVPVLSIFTAAAAERLRDRLRQRT